MSRTALFIRDFNMTSSSPGPIQFDSSDDKRGSIICASSIALFLAIVSTILRVLARRKVGAPLKADDYWIFFGCFMALNVVISTLEMVRWGLGLHIDQVVSGEALAKSVLASQIFYSLSIPTIKISILCLYHRVFPSKNLRNVSIAIGTIVVLYSVVQIICMITQCIPLSALWAGPEGQEHCWNINPVYTTVAILNVITDFAILCLPIKYVWALELARSRKIQLMSVFLLGSCVCAFGIVRAVVVGTASIVDSSYNDVGSAVWSEVEICVGVVSANLPCLRPLMRSLPKFLGGSSAPAAVSGTYGRSGKRISKGPPGIEMIGRRTKNGLGGWENIDADSDVQPFAKVAVSSPGHSRMMSNFEGISRTADDKAIASPEKAIVVETTIEITETRQDNRTQSSTSSATGS